MFSRSILVWTTVSTSYDPLTLFRLIEKTILAQTEDQYPFATVYDQERSFYSFRQETLSNAQWYERFNTKIDVGEAIGVTRIHKVLLEYVAQDLHSQDFTSLGAAEQSAVRVDAEERYISYAFLRQSGNQHGNLKVDLQNDFTTGDNHYPKNRQQTLHLLDKYSKTVVTKPITQNESSFAQGGGKGGRGGGKGKDSYDTKYWKDKECYKCGKKGHPASFCKSAEKTSNDNDDAKSIASTANSVRKLKQDFKSMSKAFATVKEQLKESESDLSGSDEEDSHFQFNTAFQFTQHESSESEVDEQQESESRLEQIFKQAHVFNKLDLREIILLDNQSTTDLFCNKKLVHETFKSKSAMRLKSNGGSMSVTRKATIPGYRQSVWFSKEAITNIIALANMTKQYRVTYDSNDELFVVHREKFCLPNMEFRKHWSGLHYYDPRDENGNLVFNTVAENMKLFSKRQIKEAETARKLYATLSYPSLKDFKWVIRSNQIKNCPVTIENIDVALKVWGKNIAALKGKTTR